MGTLQNYVLVISQWEIRYRLPAPAKRGAGALRVPDPVHKPHVLCVWTTEPHFYPGTQISNVRTWPSPAGGEPG